MAKSFKRAIACLLAVLMIVFSMPFTALAAAGDYEPDVELLFFPVKTNDWFDYSAVKGGESSSPSVPNVNPTSGLYDVALDYDKENGTLSLSAAKARPYIEYLAEGDEEFIADYYGEDGLFADGDVELAEGDFFAVTVVLDNVQTLQTLGAAISFSNNIAPAATYSSKVLGSAKKKYYEVYLGTEAEAKASGRYITGPVISDYSAELYSTDDIGVTTEDNEIDKYGNIYLNPVSDEPCADVSRLYDEEYINPKTGEMGYTYENRAIIGTFIFKIVGEGPITFSYAGDNLENYQLNTGGYYIASSLDGTGNENWTTADDNVDAPGSAGERKMTFFAAKEEEPDEHEHTYGDPTWSWADDYSSATATFTCTADDCDAADKGVQTVTDNAPAKGATVAATCSATGSQAYTATVTFNGQTYTDNATETLAIDENAHSYTSTHVDATCEDNGYTVYVCEYNAEHTYTAYDDPATTLGHDWGEATFEWNGYTATATRVCSRNEEHVETVNAVITDEVTTAPTTRVDGERTYTATATFADGTEATDTKTVPIPASGYSYTFKEWQWADNYSSAKAIFVATDDETDTKEVDATVTPDVPAASCKEDRTATYVATATYDGIEYTDTQTATVTKIEHTPGEAKEENIVKATCEEDGSYDEVVYCSVCGEEISRETKTLGKLGHDYQLANTVAATCSSYAEYTYVCSHNDSHSYVEYGTEYDYNNHSTTETVLKDAKAATCEEDGYTGDKYCKACDHRVEEGTVITNKGHAYGDATVVWNTADAEGNATATATRVCANNCGIDEVVNYSTADNTITADVTAATPDEDGVIVYSLVANDGKTYTTDVILPAAGWAFDSFVWNTETAGAYTAQAKLVSGEDSKLVAATVAIDSETAATCEEDGLRVWKATYGENTETKNEVLGKLGHDYQLDETKTVPATCSSYAEYTYVCSHNDSHSYVEYGTEYDYNNHSTTETVLKNAKDATCDAEGYTGDKYCKACDNLVEKGEAIAKTDHDWGEATFTWDGFTATATRVCANFDTHTETVDAAITDEVTTAPTARKEGVRTYTATATFADGTVATDTKTATIPASGYSYTFKEWQWADDHSSAKAIFVASDNDEDIIEVTADVDADVPAAKCEEEGTATYTATAFYDNTLYTDTQTAVVAALGHAWGDWEVVTPATREAAGLEQRVCANDASHVEKREIPALEGVLITVPKSELGTVEIKNGAAYDDGDETTDAALYTYGKEYKLVATPADDATFVGWTINGRLVSEAPTYSNVAYTDLTVTPVFAEKDKENEYTIVFFNKYGNVIATYNNEVAIPTVPQLQGYDFAGWTINGEDVTEEDVLALTESAQVWAKYEKNGAGAYTITADGAEISLPSGVENGAIPFDTKATVTFEGAAAIAAVAEDGTETVVAYGDTYTFYVGADVTLKAVAEAEEDVVVTILGHDLVAGTSNKYNIVATRAVPDGWKVKDRGFVYGQASAVPATSAEIDLDNLPAGVKATHGTPTASEQFSLAIKVGAGKTARFYAFITVQKGNETKVVFSDAYEIKA